MDKKTELIFSKLEKAMVARKYASKDLFHIIGAFVEDCPVVSRALAFHSRDILSEIETQKIEFDYTEVVVEAYRRTFFDTELAARYGTDEFPKQGIEHLTSFVEFLLSNFKIDDMQLAASTGQFTAPTMQQ